MSAPCPWPEISRPRRRIALDWRALVVGMLAGGLAAMAVCGPWASAAELPTERTWIVWNEGTNEPWTSPKGHQATATGPTACNLSLHEAALASPKGTRLACRRIDKVVRR